MTEPGARQWKSWAGKPNFPVSQTFLGLTACGSFMPGCGAFPSLDHKDKYFSPFTWPAKLTLEES